MAPKFVEADTSIAARNAFSAALASYKKHKDRILLVKFGGSLAETPEIARNILDQTAYLHEAHKQRGLLLNGGKGSIDAEIARMKKLGLIAEDSQSGDFQHPSGFRDTDKPTLIAADRALRELNGSLARLFNSLGYDVKAQGMAGYDRDIIKASPLLDMAGGFTGVIDGPDKVDRDYILHMMNSNTVPIFYPICSSTNPQDGEYRLNVNGDVVAAALGEALEDPSNPGMLRMIMCTDTNGVYDKEGKLIPLIYAEDVDRLIEDGTVSGGMVPKITSARDGAMAIHGGVVILNGRLPGALISEVTTEAGTGTLVIRRQAAKLIMK